MKYYLIAGERSGDLHGSHLVRELRLRDPSAEIRCWGGDQMEQAGAELIVHYKNLSFMGIWEVFRNLLTIKKYMDFCKKDLLQNKPDVLVLIDYPGFNLRMAEFAYQHGIKVCYFISPKLWAWNRKRAAKVKQFVNRMYSILPFEREFYQQYDYQVVYVGNPLVETISSFETPDDYRDTLDAGQRPVIAILPGSRKQEIESMLSIMLELVAEFPECKFVVAAVDNVPSEYYQQATENKDVKVVINQAYELLSVSNAAVVTSGTASLETALFDVPQVVCYKTSWLTYWTGRVLIKVPYLSLVNLIAGKQVVPELIQGEYHKDNVVRHLRGLLANGSTREDQLAGYRKVKMLLGNKSASKETAKLILDYLT
ncbi:MAG: lipid-A-disaccharide synthase [Cyclobacteriaceae bacterium]|nr:MAG: lipid-A-disaccharide synthase [Cyclobacteriaceae bacterium]